MIKFLIDNNISPRIASSLEISGFVAVHVNSIGMSASTDEEIFNYAYENNFTIVSADTDFGFILSSWKKSKPSVIIFRTLSSVPETQINYLTRVIANFANEILEGSFLIVSSDKIRIRKLPIFS